MSREFRNKLFRNKKLISAAALALLAVLIFSVPLHAALAQMGENLPPTPPPADQTPSESTSGLSTLGAVSKTLVLPVILQTRAILWLIQLFLTFILTVSAGILNWAFENAVKFNPADWPVVQVGWTVARDIANSLFILIVLWIAFTIIFGIEQYGGKKLFVRVLIIALVINFSLVAVTAVFGFSNAIAGVFAKQISDRDVAGIFANAVKLQTTTQVLEPGEKDKITGEQGKIEDALKSNSGVPKTEPSALNGFKNTLLASVGVQPAEAVDTTPNCSTGTVPGLTGGCIAGGIGKALINTLSGYGADIFDSSVNATVNLAASSLFMLVATAALLTGAIALVVRMLMMIVLSIFAPLALLTQVVPLPSVKKYWSQWTGSLFRWAFFAPGFYFLFYLDLFMLQQFDKNTATTGPTVASVDLSRIIELILALGLMIIAVKFAKKTGGAFADAAIGVGQKIGTFALGAATGGAAAGVGLLARRQAPTIEKGMEKLAGIPVLGKVTAPAARQVTGYLEEQKQKVVEKKKGLDGLSPESLVTEYSRSFTADRKVAAAQRLAELGKFSMLTDKGVKAEDVLKLANQFGGKAVGSIINARPDLASAKYVRGSAERAAKDGITEDRAARIITLEKLKTSEVTNLSDEVYKDAKGGINKEMLQDMWNSFTPEHIKRLATDKPGVVADMKKSLDDDTIQTLRPDMYRFLASTAAQNYGLKLPEDHKVPEHARKEEKAENIDKKIDKTEEKLDEIIFQLENLPERIKDLRSIGKNAEADELEKVTLRDLQRTFDKLTKNLEDLKNKKTETTGLETEAGAQSRFAAEQAEIRKTKREQKRETGMEKARQAAAYPKAGSQPQGQSVASPSGTPSGTISSPSASAEKSSAASAEPRGQETQTQPVQPESPGSDKPENLSSSQSENEQPSADKQS